MAATKVKMPISLRRRMIFPVNLLKRSCPFETHRAPSKTACRKPHSSTGHDHCPSSCSATSSPARQMMPVGCADRAHVLERHMGRAPIERRIHAIYGRRNDFEIDPSLEQACTGSGHTTQHPTPKNQLPRRLWNSSLDLGCSD